jgi:hypothetical protein
MTEECDFDDGAYGFEIPNRDSDFFDFLATAGDVSRERLGSHLINSLPKDRLGELP